MIQAGVYSAVKHYLKAIKAAEPTMQRGRGRDAQASGQRFHDRPRAHPRGRPGDAHMYLVQVKSPAEFHEPWDYEKVIATISPEEAWRPLAEGGYDLVRGAAQ